MRADALRRQAHEPRDRGLDAAFLDRARAVQVDIDRQRLGDADRVGELDRATAREPGGDDILREIRSEEHTSELQSLMRNSYAVFCYKKKKYNKDKNNPYRFAYTYNYHN